MKRKTENATEVKEGYKAFSKEGQNVEKNEYKIRHKTLTFTQKIHCNFDMPLSFCAINQASFDNKENLSPVTIPIWNVEFSNCYFRNINFIGSKFLGCKFFKCTFENCIFEKCDFYHTKAVLGQESGIIYTIITQYRNCSLINVTYSNCNLSCAIFENSNLFICNFLNSQMNRCFFDSNRCTMAALTNCNMQESYITNLSKADLEFRCDNNLKSINYLEKLYISKPNCSKLQPCEIKDNYYNISKMYYTFSQYLRSRNLDTNIEGEYNYLRHYYLMLYKDHWWNKIWDYISFITCGFGEKLSRFVIFVLFIITFPAIIYMFTGIKADNNVIKYSIIAHAYKTFDFANIINDFVLCLHLSFNTLTFSTTSTIMPFSTGSNIISIIQTLLGVLASATFTSLVIKKLIR